MTTPDCHRFRALLSLLVDDDVDGRDQTALMSHLDGCLDCRGLLEDLRRVRAIAGTLDPMTPPGHVWLEIAGQVRLDDSAPPTERAVVAGAPSRSAKWQWLGLAAALVLVTVGAYLLQGGPQPALPSTASTSSDGAGNVARNGSVEAVKDELTLAVQHYQKAIAELEAMARTESAGLDTDTALVVQRNLGTIDQAIAESQTALTDDPASPSARDSLFEALRQKVTVLQATVSLINQMRQGDSAGVARTAGRGKQS